METKKQKEWTLCPTCMKGKVVEGTGQCKSCNLIDAEADEEEQTRKQTKS